MRVLITGATGTIGREVVRALARHDDVVVRVGSRDPAAIQAQHGTVHFDFDSEGTFEPAFEGVDAFFFMSPLLPDQVSQAERVVASAVRAGVSQCVRLSSRATGWDEQCVLRRWHRDVEALVAESGMRHVMLRPCSFAQNLLGPPLEAARETGVFSIPLGAGRIPFVDVADVGEAAAICLCEPDAHDRKTYVLTGPVALSGDDVAAELATRLGRDVRYVSTPHDVVRRSALARGVPDWLVESGLRVYARAEGGGEAEVDPALGLLLGRAPGSLQDISFEMIRSPPMPDAANAFPPFKRRPRE